RLAPHAHLHPSPTRRSSDLGKAAGERTGTTHATISKYETGKRLPELEQLDQLLDVYNVPDESERAVFHELLDDASGDGWWEAYEDRKSTRLNSSHVSISYAV